MSYVPLEQTENKELVEYAIYVCVYMYDIQYRMK